MTESDRHEDMLRRHGDQPAVIMAGSGRRLTYAELDDRSTRLARVFDEAGLVRGDRVALMLGNQPEFFEAVWATLRAGLYLTPINWHLGPEEAGYIIRDCEAKAFLTSESLSEMATGLDPYSAAVTIRLMVDGSIEGYHDYDTTLSAVSGEPRTDEHAGTFMLYSSGTTGQPKGIVPPLPTAPFGAGMDTITMLMSGLYGADASSVYLSPAPLYHAAPLGFCSAIHRLGATALVMERFDAAQVLTAIERYGVTHAQFVPTHFIRMLRLPDEVRSAHDLSSLRKVLHAAAPCPVPVKHQMIEWLGPIVEEYYAGSEAFGVCLISSKEWLEHPGSVGRPVMGGVHIVDHSGDEVPTGETGQVWFEATTRFAYNNDPEKTRSAQDERGWATYGDIGWVDEDGYLYLTDRASNMIISGGVNIYPQEAENVLSAHPEVQDVAVLGVPDDDMGERVKAFVELRSPSDDPDATAAELIEFCRGRLAPYKCPREVEFVDELPRMETGKLLKRRLVEQN
jgi:long-chain acyl-CoA synthetase